MPGADEEHLTNLLDDADRQKYAQGDTNGKPVSNLLNDEDRAQYVKNTPPKKPNPIVKLLSNIGLVGGAAVAATGAAGGLYEGSPTQPFKEGVHISQKIADHVIPNNDKQAEQDRLPAISEPSPEPQSSVGEEALSASPDLSELNKIFDTFVDDLKQIPGAKMYGMQEAGVEGYKIAIGEKTIKFMLKPSDNDHSLDEITVEIKTDAETKNWTIIGREIEYQHKFNDPSKAEESAPPAGKSTGEILTDELNNLYQQWNQQRVKGGEIVTSADQAIPPDGSQIAEPSPTNTPEPIPTPTETPMPYNSNPAPFDREIHEASANPTTEVQNSQPVATDSTTPKSDL